MVSDENGTTLGLVYSNAESVARAFETRTGVYHSRSRGLWEKGKTSGDVQALTRIYIDCDRDALMFQVVQQGSGFCHTGRWSCFDEERGLTRLERTLRARAQTPVDGSLTARLLVDAELLTGKLREEAGELGRANEPEHVAEEAADLLYFAAVAMTRANVSFAQVARVLDRRALKVIRRKPRDPDGPRLRPR